MLVVTGMPTCHGQTPATTPSAGSVSGAITDAFGAVIPNATVALLQADLHRSSTTTDNAGTFNFPNVAAGQFNINVTAAGFAPRSESGTLQPGEIRQFPIALALPASTTNVVVHETEHELAEQQMQIDEHQRVLGVVPNFYVEYNPSAVALDAKQKFKLASRYNFDPVNVTFTAGLAGVEQASNSYSGFGQGTLGYAKYFGADLASFTTASILSNAILPAVLHQDPRYYVKGSGTVKARFLYAIANVFICKGDNRGWQPNYSGMIGGLAASGISNYYYPAANRNGAGLMFENFGIGILGGAGGNLFQEFFSRRFSTGVPKGS